MWCTDCTHGSIFIEVQLLILFFAIKAEQKCNSTAFYRWYGVFSESFYKLTCKITFDCSNKFRHFLSVFTASQNVRFSHKSFDYVEVLHDQNDLVPRRFLWPINICVSSIVKSPGKIMQTRPMTYGKTIGKSYTSPSNRWQYCKKKTKEKTVRAFSL